MSARHWLDTVFEAFKIKDATTTFAKRAALKFTGAGVAVADDASGDQTIITIAGGGGLSFAGEAQGDIAIRGATVWQRLAAGTNGYFLKTFGPGALPGWAAVAVGGGAWTTILEIDFTTEATQSFMAGDGYKTLTTSGKQILIGGTAVCSAFGVINGTGLQATISSASTGAQLAAYFNGTTTPEMAEFKAGEEWEYTFAFTVSAMASNTELVNMAFGEVGGNDRGSIGYVYNGGAKNTYTQYADPGSAPSAKVNLTTLDITADDVFQVRVKNATYLEQYQGPFTGGAGGTWDKTLRLRGWRQHAVQNAAWVQGGSQQSAGINTFAGGVSGVAGRVYTLKYVRIRRRSV